MIAVVVHQRQTHEWTVEEAEESRRHSRVGKENDDKERHGEAVLNVLAKRFLNLKQNTRFLLTTDCQIQLLDRAHSVAALPHEVDEEPRGYRQSQDDERRGH